MVVFALLLLDLPSITSVVLCLIHTSPSEINYIKISICMLVINCLLSLSPAVSLSLNPHLTRGMATVTDAEWTGQDERGRNTDA